MDIVFEEKRMITVRDILSRPDSNRYAAHYGEALAMMPLKNQEERVQGVINIEKMDFFAFNRVNLEMIELAVDWVSRAIAEIQLFHRTRAQLIRDEEYGIYTFAYFEKSLNEEFERARKFQLHFSVGVLKLERYGFLAPESQKLMGKSLVAFLKRHLSETDRLFHYRFDGTFAVLAPMRTAEELEVLLEKALPEIEKLSGHLTCKTNEYHGQVNEPAQLLAPVLRECRLGTL
jgi:GGDEF domain-containing protein